MIEASVLEVTPSPAAPHDSDRLPTALPLLRAVADPVRWNLLQILATGPSCVCDLQARIPIAANLLSYHLKVLREARLVETSRRGRWIDYRLADDALVRLHAALPGPADTEPGRP